MKRYFLISFLILLFGMILGNHFVYAADLDLIENYVITVDPRMNDGTLDITYEITWKVLDSKTQGPLEWVTIGTPNEYFDTPTAITSNIKKIQKYNGSYVRIDFNKSYESGQTFTFKYSIHQSNVYRVSGSKCKYTFTPAWFTDSEVNKIKIKWNADAVSKSDTKEKEDNYFVWQKSDLKKGGKLTIQVEYPKEAFSSLKKVTTTDSVMKEGIIWSRYCNFYSPC